MTSIYSRVLLDLFGQSQAGNKAALSHSAVYPYQFGLAVVGLLPPREDRPECEVSEFPYPSSEDAWGAVDDLVKGRNNCWWRKL